MDFSGVGHRVDKREMERSHDRLDPPDDEAIAERRSRSRADSVRVQCEACGRQATKDREALLSGGCRACGSTLMRTVVTEAPIFVR
jgi:DNA polymerase II large subunit